MRQLRAVIVEDELHAVRRLSMALKAVPDLTIEAVAREGAKGLELIQRLAPDVAFLDIALPGMTGLEIAAELVKSEPPVIVFVTAFDRFATEAFRVAAVDYLLKPVDFAQVAETVERARERVDARHAGDRVRDLERLIQTLRDGARPTDPTPRYETEIWVTDRRGAVRVSIASVEWFEAEGDYVLIHADSGSYLVRDTLHLLETRLDPQRFRRVHRSAIINLDRLSRVDRRITGASELVLNSGVRVPVGRTYSRQLKGLITRERPAGSNGADGSHAPS